MQENTRIKAKKKKKEYTNKKYWLDNVLSSMRGSQCARVSCARWQFAKVFFFLAIKQMILHERNFEQFSLGFYFEAA